MAKAYLNLIKAAIEAGFEIEVYLDDGWESDEDDNYRGIEYKRIKDDIECVDGGANFAIWDGKECIANVVLVIGYGNADEETVADWACRADSLGGRWMDNWHNKFCKEHEY